MAREELNPEEPMPLITFQDEHDDGVDGDKA